MESGQGFPLISKSKWSGGLVVDPSSSRTLPIVRQAFRGFSVKDFIETFHENSGADVVSRMITLSLCSETSLVNARTIWSNEFRSRLSRDDAELLDHADNRLAAYVGGNDCGDFSAAAGLSVGLDSGDYRSTVNVKDVPAGLVRGIKLMKQREQMFFVQSGLVDSEGMVCVYRFGSRMESKKGNVPDGSIIRLSGGNADSWSLVFDISCRTGHVAKGMIHVSKLLSTFIGRDSPWPESIFCSPVFYGVHIDGSGKNFDAESKQFLKAFPKLFLKSAEFSISGVSQALPNSVMDAMKSYAGYGSGAEQCMSENDLAIAAKYGSNPVAVAMRTHGIEDIPPEFLSQVSALPGNPAPQKGQSKSKSLVDQKSEFIKDLTGQLIERYGSRIKVLREVLSSSDPQLPFLGMSKYRSPGAAMVDLFGRIEDLSKNGHIEKFDSKFDPVLAADRFSPSKIMAVVDSLVFPPVRGSTMWSYLDIDSRNWNLVDGTHVVAVGQNPFVNARNGAWMESYGGYLSGYWKGMKVFSEGKESVFVSKGDPSFWFVNSRNGGTLFCDGERVLSLSSRLGPSSLFYGIGLFSVLLSFDRSKVSMVIGKHGSEWKLVDKIPMPISEVESNGDKTIITIKAGHSEFRLFYVNGERVFENVKNMASSHSFANIGDKVIGILHDHDLQDLDIGEMAGMKLSISSGLQPKPKNAVELKTRFLESMDPGLRGSSNDYWDAVERMAGLSPDEFLTIFASIRKEVSNAIN